MFTVVADTNIYISAFSFGGTPERFLKVAATGAFRLAVSDAILNEVVKVLRSEKFGWPEEQLGKARQQILRLAVLVETGQELQIISTDPSDNRILECAAASDAAYIVSGDKHLLRLHHFSGTPVLKVADFMRRFEGEQPKG